MGLSITRGADRSGIDMELRGRGAGRLSDRYPTER